MEPSVHSPAKESKEKRAAARPVPRPGSFNIFRSLLDALRVPVHCVDLDMRIIYWNEAATRQTGFEPQEVLWKIFNQEVLEATDLVERPILPAQCPLRGAVTTGKPASLELHIRRRDGLRIPFALHASPIRDEANRVIGAVCCWVDIRNNIDYLQDQADVFRRLKQLENAAYNDLLTGLPNRRSAESRLAQSMKRLADEQSRFGILLFDIDNFKRINDDNGHAVGDYALRGVATVLRAALRGNDMMFRWGGDEFLAIVSAEDHLQLQICAERCRSRIQDNRWNEVENCPQITVTIGGSMANSIDNINSLLERADEQLFQAKNAGKNRVMIAHQALSL
ncbi:MAG: diguanylate cyclase [Bryobacterales bacterium]|jgi:diguanylate cyclase (GGDEF)-like protein/PAS domain S-box-containing protein|nr:diguanylate cyclase [Bryobacterales bacterium]